MRLVWTYNGNPVTLDKSDYKTIVRINYYITSISIAKRMGYKTVMYCDKFSFKYFHTLVDEIYVLPQYDTPFWDVYKIDVLERESGDYCLIDGDILLHDKLPELTADLTIDCFEIKTFKNYYKPTIDLLTELGIKEVVPEWENREQNMINHGIMCFRNDTFKHLYLERWKSYGEFINKNRDKIEDMTYASLASQYVLVVLMNANPQWKVQNLSNKLGKPNEYYTHFAGDMKFDNPKVPSDKLITLKQKEWI